jgi:hypothetical protein
MYILYHIRYMCMIGVVWEVVGLVELKEVNVVGVDL